MSTTTHLTNKLDEILMNKSAIKSAIIDMGGTFSGTEELSDYPAAIRSIPTTVVGDTDWILKVKAGIITNASNYSLEDLPSYNLSGYYLFYGCTDLEKAPAISSACSSIGEFSLYSAFDTCFTLNTPPDFSNITYIDQHGLGRALSGCNSIEYIDFSSLARVEDFGCYYAFSGCSFTNVDFPSLTYVGNNAFIHAFEWCIYLVSADFSSLTYAGNEAFNQAFINCQDLVSVDFSSLTSLGSRAFNGAFDTCQSLVNFTVNPIALRYSDASTNPVGSAIYVENIYLSDNVTDDIYVNWLDNMNDQSYLRILEHLGNIYETKTCAFPEHSIEDISGGDYYTAYNAAVEKGWNITGLTIIMPDYITVTSGYELNLKSSNTITFDSLYSWTADTDNPLVTLSGYSGNAGEGITITVSIPNDWYGDVNVNLHASDGQYTDTKSVDAYYTEYTEVEYLQPPLSGYCEFGLDTFSYNDKMEMDVYWPSTFTESILGNHSGTYVYVCRMIYGYLGSYMLYDYPRDMGSTRLKVPINVLKGRTLTTLGFDAAGHPTITVNNTDVYTMNSTITGTYTGYPFKIFGIDYNQLVDTEVKYYGIRWERNGVLIHDYKPVLDPNNVACFYDNVTREFVYPTSGSCRPGPAI